jgi:hypothetical protein
MFSWVQSLPSERGIPLGSCMSVLCAALALVPVWLSVKKQFSVQMFVYNDDVLLLCKHRHTAQEVFHELTNRLSNDLELNLNLNKTKAGRFSAEPVHFCGWTFAGGYAAIAEEKMQAFRERIIEWVRHTRRDDTRAFVKRINRKIDGFGNYYKYGNVVRQFDALDRFLRTQVRQWLTHGRSGKAYSNDDLERLGLHSLMTCYRQAQQKKAAKTNPRDKSKRKLTPVARQPTPARNFYDDKPAKPDYGAINAIAKNTEKMCAQNQQIIGLLRELVTLLNFDAVKNM